MDRRIHGVLDGERDRGELTPAERARLREYEEAVAASLDAIGDEPAPDVSGAVMARIAEMHGEAATAPAAPSDGNAGVGATIRSALAALWRPRVVRVRPAWGLAAAAVVALVVAVAPSSPDGPLVIPGPGAAVAGEAGTVLVRFRLDAADARSVRLAGDFTGWEPAHEMHEQAPGVWAVTVAVPTGVHEYAFVVDGREWRADPLAPPVDDGFGGTNSRLALLEPEAGAS